MENPIDQKSTNLVAENRRETLVKYLKQMDVYDSIFQRIIDFLHDNTDYFYGPSSTRWHAAYPGGGFDHAFNVTQCLVEFTQKGICSEWKRPVSPYLIGLLHDVTKCGAYTMKQEMNPNTNEIETWYEYNTEHYLESEIHGEDSLIKILKYLDLTDEEQACIRWHMGAYEGKESWPDFDAVIKKFPNVLFTHTADMYASKCMETRLEGKNA